MNSLPNFTRRARILQIALFSGLIQTMWVEGHTFKVIGEKNIFRLREPMEPLPASQPVALAKITLTGITTIFGQPLALFEWVEPGNQKKNYGTLHVGETDGPIEILQIDAKAATVTLKNHGMTATIAFEQAAASPTPILRVGGVRNTLPANPPDPPK